MLDTIVALLSSARPPSTAIRGFTRAAPMVDDNDEQGLPSKVAQHRTSPAWASRSLQTPCPPL